ncbi:NTP transferase domain-containing protein [uncultured Lutibacter sp.]|uniref:nucleotidyltransferase family protein n=1 Tax=uncultured Lutibacter sp. TaxID=437739 RepID=UPI00261B1D20|nr:NTP transferase domain-containing protein [uncultured Lutibacter sp.]
MENKKAFILLAGGKSERMGVAKGLLKYQQTFWILEQLNRISKISIKEVYIGLGYYYDHYFSAIPWLKIAQKKTFEFQGLNVKTVINKNPDLGSFSTLQTVLKAIPKQTTILINPIDTPLLNSEELAKLISEKNEVVFPNFEGKNGHPIKISSRIWNNFLTINTKDKNARLDFQLKKVSPTKITIVNVSDRAIILNLNTKKEWVSFLKTLK